MLYCPNFFWNVLQVWMTGKDVYLQMTWSWPDKTWNILCSYCLQWNTSQSKFRNHYFLFLFAFSILSQLFLIWGCIYIYMVCVCVFIIKLLRDIVQYVVFLCQWQVVKTGKYRKFGLTKDEVQWLHVLFYWSRGWGVLAYFLLPVILGSA